VADESVKVEVHGVDELAAGSRRLFDHIESGAEKSFVSTADQVATIIGGKQPVLTGRLAASATAEGIDRGASVGIGGPGVPYAGWIEFGGTRGRPYVPMGRTVYPTAEETKAMFEHAGDKVAAEQIGAMLWPKPSL
jgi:phage gpG-like protein